MRSRDALKRSDSFFVTARTEQGPAQKMGPSIGVVGIELHRLFDPFHAFLRPPKPRKDFAPLGDEPWIVRIYPEGLFIVVLSIVKPHFLDTILRKNTDALEIVLVERNRFARQIQNFRVERIGSLAIPPGPSLG